MTGGTGRLRAGLVLSALPLVLVLPAAAVAFGGFSLINTFSGMAVSGTGGEATVLAACARLWTLVRVAAGGVALLSLFFLPLGLVPFGAPRDAVPALSARRAVVLSVLPLCACLLVGAQVAQMRSALRVSAAVVRTPASDAERAAARDVMRSEGLPGEGSAGIAETSNLISIRTILAGLGGIVVLVVLPGLALTGLFLAAPVRVGTAFVVAASLSWLAVAAVSAAVALGAFLP
jgi:hypothetical protein